MDPSNAAYAPDLGIFLSPVNYIIGFVGLIVVLAMLKNFIAYGVSIAVTEYLLKNADNDERMKVVRWFVKGNQILAAINLLDRRMRRDDDEGDTT
ncbi:hypothetical protein CL628_01725 [bacterium]|nr:hypothetical protein [bacterium]|tara:strand:- start:252 stop:536 length:285 start_codon:yes stop_codon:yes gene_type:complete